MRKNGGDEVVHVSDSDTGERMGEVILLGISGGQVSMGFEFEKWVSIERDCVKRAKEQGNG